MGFWDRLWNGKERNHQEPDIRFGRYTDSYKTDANYAAWEKALEKFEEEEYLESYRQFFTYLRDEREDNVRFWESDERIYFELFQGSKKITGFADTKKIKAEAKVAHSDNLNVGFMRRLIEKNFNLEYSRFSLDPEDNITIVFDTYTLDGSPYKLYYALKEVATNADKQDDLLLDEFKMLTEVDNSHLTDLPESVKEVRYQFITTEIDAVLEEVENGKLSFDQYPGAYVYLLLNLLYKLDYLVKPEGYMMENLELAHRHYFAKDNKSTQEKAKALIRDLKQLRSRSKEDLFKEMYRVKSTFGITVPVNHDRVVGCIDNEIVNMDWYNENGYTDFALAIAGFIVGYCLFNYAVPKPVRDLFHLYYQITEGSFFSALGFEQNLYHPETQQFNKREIRRAIDQIVQENRNKFPKLKPVVKGLRYQSKAAFAKSFLYLVRNLDMTKVD